MRSPYPEIDPYDTGMLDVVTLGFALAVVATVLAGKKLSLGPR